MRDVYAVDTKPVRPKEPRIALLLAEPTHGKWQTAQQVLARTRGVSAIERRAVVQRPGARDAMPEADSTAHASHSSSRDQKRLNGAAGVRTGIQGDGQDTWSASILQMPGDPVASGRFWVDAGHRPTFIRRNSGRSPAPTVARVTGGSTRRRKARRAAAAIGVAHVRDPASGAPTSPARAPAATQRASASRARAKYSKRTRIRADTRLIDLGR